MSESVANFMTRARLLETKLGPMLYQLPPSMKRDDHTLEEFLKILPEGAQHVFEFRNRSWFDNGVFEILHRYRAGICIYDMPDFTTPAVTTADFAYIRFHGRDFLYGGSYSDEELEEWAGKIAVQNAITLKRLLE